MITAIGLILLFLILMVLGIPIAFVIGIVSYVGFLVMGTVPLEAVIQQMFVGLNSFILLAVPLFIFAANIMNRGKISERLIQFAVSLVGHIRGGLAHSNVVVSMFFGGISGASTADTAGVGKILIPSMKKEQYSTETSVAVTAASSTMGMIIPPSIPMVIYGSLAGVSIGQMFIGGIIPGLLIGVGLMLFILVISKKNNYPKHDRLDTKAIVKHGIRSFPPLLTPIIILVGIMGGFVTPTEASIIACIYSFILAYFFYKSIRLRDMPDIVIETLKLSSLTLFALATATSLGRLISFNNIPAHISSFFQESVPYAWLLIVLIIVLFLFVGMFMDTVPSIILFVPIILPAASELGLDPIHLGIVVLMCLAVGLVTPPYGLCLLLASAIGGLSISRSFKATIPYIGMIMVVILVIAFVPGIFMWLPNAFE